MEVIRLAGGDEVLAGRSALERAGIETLAESDRPCGGEVGTQLLVRDASAAVDVLRSAGLQATRVSPPVPNSGDAILWWKAWRDALPIEVYSQLRLRHHRELSSEGSIVRVRREEFPAEAEEPWRVLADGGVDIRCEFHCALPTGMEVHVLVPDKERAVAVLAEAGFTATPVDYEGPRIRDGITWWGQWKAARDYASQVQRPILMSFASPRVEQVPGVW